MLAITILAVAFGALLSACAGAGATRFLRALTVFGLAVWAITEGLSLFEAIRFGPVLACWCVVAGAATCAGWRRRAGAAETGTPSDHGGWLAALCGLGIAAILCGTALTAWFSPPNSADAMAYHAPRVLFWAEQGSVRFFPTPYLNQIMLQPFAEYVNLQSYVLTGGDRFFNLPQWFASLACVVAVWGTAGELGANGRGRAIAALFSATIPIGILASSGAKNDYVLAMWLATAVFFALRWRRTGALAEAAWMGLALGLALFTKATAYLFAPWILAAICARPVRAHPREALRGLALALPIALALSTPLFVRNIGLSGSPMGSDSAQGDGYYRWRNETFGWKQTASNVLRNFADQLGMRSPAWNQWIYKTVLQLHQAIGADPNDPATTWREARYAVPRNDSHEADAPNPWQVGLLIVAGLLLCGIAFGGGRRLPAAYALALLMGFAAFCFYLKWQPYMSRLFLPLFVLSAPLIGIAAGYIKIKPQWFLAALCLFLLDGARRPLLNNWVRPLRGQLSILHRLREEQYFSDMSQFGSLQASYFATRDLLAKSTCQTVGIDADIFQLEYPLEAILRDVRPGVQFEHVGVDNASRKYRQPAARAPCAVVCLQCAGSAARLERYRDLGDEARFGETVVWVRR